MKYLIIGDLHGHFGKDKIGKTTIINSGFGGNVNTLMELSKDKIKKLGFYNGSEEVYKI